jgi:protein-tyrosine phosphatase
MLKLVEDAGLAQHIFVDSAGTSAYHAGEAPDPRTFQTAKLRGVHLPSIARQWQRADFQRFDYVLAMDQQNQRNLLALSAPEMHRKIQLLRRFDPRGDGSALDVPDPYYGGPSGFDQVFEICEAACRGLLAHVRTEHGL